MSDSTPRARQFPSSNSFELMDEAHAVRGASFVVNCGYCRRFIFPHHVTLHFYRSSEVEALGWEERRSLKVMEMRRLPPEWADACLAEWVRLRPDAVVSDQRPGFGRGVSGPKDFVVMAAADQGDGLG